MPITDPDRENTLALIDQNPETVTLRRSPRTPDGMGGWAKGVATFLPPQQARLVPRGGVVRTEVEGHQDMPGFQLIGAPEMDIRAHDEFTLGDADYEVVSVSPSRLWSTRADVVRRG